VRRRRHFVRVWRRLVLPDVVDRHDAGDARRLQIALVLRSYFRRHLRTAGQQQTGSSGRIRPGAVRTLFQFPEIHLSKKSEKHGRRVALHHQHRSVQTRSDCRNLPRQSKRFCKKYFFSVTVFALTTLIFGCLKYGRRWSEFIKVSWGLNSSFKS